LEESLEKRIEKHPGLKERVLAMLDIIDNTDETLTKANDAEERVL